MTQALNLRALQYATQRVEDFALIHRSRKDQERVESIDLWLSSLGLDEELRTVFERWAIEFMGPNWDGGVVIGFIVGLLLIEYNEEHRNDL